MREKCPWRDTHLHTIFVFAELLLPTPPCSHSTTIKPLPATQRTLSGACEATKGFLAAALETVGPSDTPIYQQGLLQVIQCATTVHTGLYHMRSLWAQVEAPGPPQVSGSQSWLAQLLLLWPCTDCPCENSGIWSFVLVQLVVGCFM